MEAGITSGAFCLASIDAVEGTNAVIGVELGAGINLHRL
jgi:hypothetical protein